MSKRVPLQIYENNKIQSEKNQLVKKQYKESKRNKAWEFARSIKKPVVRKREEADYSSPPGKNSYDEMEDYGDNEEVNFAMEDPLLL